MKSIIINYKFSVIIKNNNTHCIYYDSIQESFWHNKKKCYSFQNKRHYYYKKVIYDGYFNSKHI
jgi:hypothetical protein